MTDLLQISHASIIAVSLLQAQLSAVLGMMSREALRQILRVFQMLYLPGVAENRALREKVASLEVKLRSKVALEVDTSKKMARQSVSNTSQTGQCHADTPLNS